MITDGIEMIIVVVWKNVAMRVPMPSDTCDAPRR